MSTFSVSIINDILTSISRLPFAEPDPSSQRTTTNNNPGTHSKESHHAISTNSLLKLPPSATKEAQSLFLTLHFLFPHELLPALDILDRDLVVKSIPSIPTSHSHPTQTPMKSDVYYVQSASAIKEHRRTSSDAKHESGRFRDAMAGGRGKSIAKQTHYEVRLDSWNCNCAAFAYSAFTLLQKDEAASEGQFERRKNEEEAREEREQFSDEGAGQGYRDWAFGGTLTTLETGVPVCKHILAALMARAAPKLFGEQNVKVTEVGMMASAGWAAGWGEGG